MESREEGGKEGNQFTPPSTPKTALLKKAADKSKMQRERKNGPQWMVGGEKEKQGCSNYFLFTDCFQQLLQTHMINYPKEYI